MSEVASEYAAAPADVGAPPHDAARDLRDALLVVAALAVVGAVLGLLWAWWSPLGPQAFRRMDGLTWAISEDESSVAGDGRYVVLTAATGLVAGILMWTWTRLRGPAGLAAVTIGCLVSAQLTRLVGYLTGGGSTTGNKCTLLSSPPVDGNCITHQKLSVHSTGFEVVGAAVAVLVYVLCASFVSRDDLGRPDPVRGSILRRRLAPYPPAADLAVGASDPSVGDGGQP